MSMVENYSMVSRQRTTNKPNRNSIELSLEDSLVSFAESLIHCAVDWTWQKCSKDRFALFDRHDENDPCCFSSSNDDGRSATTATLSTTNSRLSRMDLPSSVFIRGFVTLDPRLSFDDDRGGAALLEDFDWSLIDVFDDDELLVLLELASVWNSSNDQEPSMASWTYPMMRTSSFSRGTSAGFLLFRFAVLVWFFLLARTSLGAGRCVR